MKALLFAVAAFALVTALTAALVCAAWLGTAYEMGKGSDEWPRILPWISLFFIPLLLSSPVCGVAAGVFAYRRVRGQQVVIPAGSDAGTDAVVSAIEGHRKNGPATLCPTCSSQISVHSYSEEGSRPMLKLSCKCGRSSGVFNAS